MTTNHKHFLSLAFNLAHKNLGNTKLNPSVGVVVVKNNSVFSSGITSIDGRPHAEFNALNTNYNLSGATLYSTLEPCTHQGLTPPCTNIIIHKKIKNVCYYFNDPDLRTHKKAKKILQNKKIRVKQLEIQKFKNFYSSYILNKKKKLPYISAKIAISNDYYSINKKHKWITNDHSRKISQLLRSQNDCIISTSKSINKDNSLLNCRINGLNQQSPDLFIIDLKQKLKKNLQLNKLIKNRRTFLVTKQKNINNLQFFKKKGYKIIIIKSLKDKNDFNKMFKKIYDLGYGRIFCETGLTFLNSLLYYKLLNNLYVFKSKKKLTDNGLNNSSVKQLKKIKLKKK